LKYAFEEPSDNTSTRDGNRTQFPRGILSFRANLATTFFHGIFNFPKEKCGSELKQRRRLEGVKSTSDLKLNKREF
jgi:hypothetical protein